MPTDASLLFSSTAPAVIEVADIIKEEAIKIDNTFLNILALPYLLTLFYILNMQLSIGKKQ